MTQLPSEPQGAPPPRRPARPPVWPYFLTPVAVLLGAVAIVVTIIVTDDDAQPAPEPIAPALEALSAAAESLSNAADALADAAQAPPAPASAGERAREPEPPPAVSADPTTLREALDGYAASLDLDADRFGQCLASSATYDAVGEQLQRGIDLGVNGTPTFFINNKLISGAQAASIFTEVIAAELAGSPTSIDEYSDAVRLLANRDPPSFAILPDRPDFTGAPIEGSPDARVVIIEFSDFQCPFCQRWYYNALPEIRQFIGDEVAIAFLHFPIAQLHPNAPTVHVAAQCAGEQDKFWEMHDLLFEEQEVWSRLPNVN